MIFGSFSFALGCLLVWWIGYLIEKHNEKKAEQNEISNKLRIAKNYYQRYGAPDPRTSRDEQIREFIVNYQNTHENDDDDIISDYYFVSRLIGHPLENRVGYISRLPRHMKIDD